MASRDTFDYYREIVARKDQPASCGHHIKAGDRIGYNRHTRRDKCAACWLRWVAEVDEARARERGF